MSKNDSIHDPLTWGNLADFANDLLNAWNIEDLNEPSLTEQFLYMFSTRFGVAK